MSRLLFVVESLAEGGAERSLVEMLPGFAAAGHRTAVALLFARGGLEERAREAGAELFRLPEAGWAGRVHALRRLVAEWRPGLVHSMLFRSDLVARLALRGGGPPLLTSLVGDPFDPARRAGSSTPGWKRRLARAADGWTARRWTTHYHAVSETVRAAAGERLRMPTERITVVPRGRDRRRLGRPGADRRQRVRRALGLADDAPVAITVGRQHPLKGHAHLLRALARAPAPDGRLPVLLLAGAPGGATAALTRLASELGLGERLRDLGHREDVGDLLAAADLFVLPSLSEGMPGAALEAMALELPVVASDIPALREIVADGESGLLVPPGDEEALARAISRLLADCPLARRLGRRGGEIFEQRFTLERAVEGHLALYARLLAGAREAER